MSVVMPTRPDKKATKAVSDCCVCGEWDLRERLRPLNSDRLHPRCVRLLNTTLRDKCICRRCAVACPRCKQPVTWAHCWLQNGAKECRHCA
jgi:hypothetical protein